MKKNRSKCLLIALVCLASFVLSSCMAKTEKLAELEKTQLQMQKEIDQIRKEADEAKQRAEKYERLSNEYQARIASKNQELNSLQETYTELDKKDDSKVETVKKVLKDKLIESAQASVHLEKRFKRYNDQAKAYKEKSQQLDEKAKETEQSVKQTTQEITQIKEEIVNEQQSQQTSVDG